MKVKGFHPFLRGISILLIVMIALTAMPVSPATAGSSAKLGTLFGNMPVGTNYDWLDLFDLVDDNDYYAYIDLPAGAYSDRLYVHGFNLGIPAGATIEGIQVNLPRRASASNAIRDVAISLVRGGVVVGTPKTVAGNWPRTETVQPYGGPTDTWGVTGWTPAQINADDFGVTVEVRNNTTSTQRPYVDYVQVIVTYSIPTTLEIGTVTAVHGETAALSATLAPAAAGKTVSFMLNGTAACSANTNALGVAACTPATAFTMNAGTYEGYITAAFAGDIDYKASSAVGRLIVAPRPITVTAVVDEKVYDGTTSSSGIPTITSGSLLAGDTAVWSQSFDNKNAGTGKEIIPSGVVTDGNGGNNYIITFANVSGTINKRPITISAVPDTKVYDGTTGSSGVPQLTSGSLVEGETGTWVQAFNHQNAGAVRSLIPSGIVADSNNGGNYAYSFISAPGEISKRPITVTAVTDTRVYDGTVDSTGEPEITSGSLAAGDTADWTQVFDNENAGPNKVLTPSGNVSDGNNGGNYTVTFVDAAGAITKRPLTVSAVTDTRAYDGTVNSNLEPTVTGTLAQGDSAEWLQAFDTKHAGQGKAINASGTIEDGNDGNNYAVTYEPATGVITPREITVSATGATKEYDGTTASPVKPTITSGTLAVGDTAEWSQTYVDANAGKEKTINPSGTIEDGNGGKNYLILFNSDLGEITPRPLTVTAETDVKAYDGTAASDGTPALTAGTLVEGDTVTWTQAFEDKHAGTLKTITPAGVVDDGNGGKNYEVDFVSVSDGEITARPITVTAVTDTKVYDGTPDTATAPSVPAGALVGGDTPAFTQSFVDEHVGTDKVIKATGKVNDGNNGGNYTVTFVDATGTITQRRIVVTAALETKVYDGTPDSSGVPTITEGELAVGDTVAWTQAFENKHTGSRIIMPGGAVADGNNGDNYFVVFQFVYGQIDPRPITVSAVEDTKVYDGSDSSAKKPEVTEGTIVSGDLPDFWQGFENKHVGTGKLIRSWGIVRDGNGSSNYTITFEEAEGAITPRSITVTAVSDSKVYDGTTYSGGLPTVTEGTLAGDDAPGWTQRFADEHAGVGKTILPEGVAQDGNGGSNYDVKLVSVTTGEITPRPVTVSAVTDVKIYDGTVLSDGTPYISGGSFLASDSVVWSQAFTDANVGAAKVIIPSGVIDDGNNGGNYEVTAKNALGIITPREITVTAVTDSKVYDGRTDSALEPEITEGELAPGDTAQWMQRFEDEHAGTGKKLTPGGEIADGNNGGNYSVEFVSVETGAITPLPITVSAKDDAKVYNGTKDSTPLPEITGGTLVAGDTPAFTQEFATRNAGENIAIQVVGRVIDGNDGKNYQVTAVSAEGDITPRPITVTAVTDTKVYDGSTTSSKTPEITSGVIVDGDSEDFFQAFDNKNAGAGKTITPDGSVEDGNNGDNYIVTFVDVDTGEITKLAITVTADSVTKQFGETDPALTFTVSPALAIGDTFTGALEREAGEAVGVYEITQGTLSAGANYDLTFAGADFIITKADQVITVTQHAPINAIEGMTFEVAATSSSGLPVTYTASGSCTNDGAVFTMTSNSGTCQVIFDQAGDDSYNAAEPVIELVKAGVIAIINIFTPIIAK